MEDKENLKRFRKRQSSVLNDDIIMHKRQAFHLNNSRVSNYETNEEESYESSNINPLPVVSSCLTSDFKVSCKLNNTSETCEISLDISTLEKDVIPIDIFKPLMNNETNQHSHNENQIMPLSKFKDTSNLKLNTDNYIKDNLELNSEPNFGTPNEQILPFAEFRKLPKPLLSASDKLLSLNKSLTDYAGPCQTDHILDSSFEILKYGNRNLSTPIIINFNPTFLTPETPSNIHDIDLEKQVLPSLNSIAQVKFKRSITNMSISPMFYDNFHKSTKKEIKIVRRSRTEVKIQPDLSTWETNQIKEMTAERVSKIIDNDYTNGSFAYNIIDCRYPYEYDGGHIESAVNLYTPWQILNYVYMCNYEIDSIRQPLENPAESLRQLLDKIIHIDKPNSKWKYQAYIFHCEFSSKRGPQMARCLRNVDRYANISCYPNLYFPKVYIMKKGYKEFYKNYKGHCIPRNYVRMDIRDPNNKGSGIDCTELDESVEEDANWLHLDEETRQRQIRQYNDCEKEKMEQIKLMSQLLNDC